MTIIGLTGKAGAGKDTVGEFLVQQHGFTRFAYADVLKRAALHVDPLIFETERLSDVVREHGYDFAKRAFPEVRRFLQEMGLAMRQVYPEVWLMPLDRLHAEDVDIVVTDVRFDNEAAQVIDLGGEVYLIDRPGLYVDESAAGHASERGISPDLISGVITNTGTIEALLADAKEVINL